MKALVVGLGSMGKRRVGNLLALKVGEVRGFDVRSDRRDEANKRFGISSFDSFETALQWEPDVLVISTPPDDHLPYATAAAERGKHFFTELSINPEGLAELNKLARVRGVIAAPSCTPRFNPMIRRIRSLVEDGTIGQPTNMIAYAGQYLPDWHPWEDYRQFFAAKKRTGACREILAFDMLWMPWVLGPVAEIGCMRSSLGSLECDIDDVYQVSFRSNRGTLGVLQIDAISRLPIRHYRFVSETGLIIWDWRTQFLQVYTAKDGKWKEYAESSGFAGYSVENVYLEEMKAFTDAVQHGTPFPLTLEEDLERVNLLVAAEESAEKGRRVKFEENK